MKPRSGLTHLVAALACLFLTSACITPGLKDGAAIGGVVGAAVGGVAGGGGGALVGAGAGLVVGGVAGTLITDRDAKGPDRDGDGVSDVQDNCPDISNDTQQDANGNGRGDACDNSAP